MEKSSLTAKESGYSYETVGGSTTMARLQGTTINPLFILLSSHIPFVYYPIFSIYRILFIYLSLIHVILL